MQVDSGPLCISPLQKFALLMSKFIDCSDHHTLARTPRRSSVPPGLLHLVSQGHQFRFSSIKIKIAFPSVYVWPPAFVRFSYSSRSAVPLGKNRPLIGDLPQHLSADTKGFPGAFCELNQPRPSLSKLANSRMTTHRQGRSCCCPHNVT